MYGNIVCSIFGVVAYMLKNMNIGFAWVKEEYKRSNLEYIWKMDNSGTYT